MELRKRCRVALPLIAVVGSAVPACAAQITPAHAVVRKLPLLAAHNTAGKANRPQGTHQPGHSDQGGWPGGPPPGQGPGGPPPGMAESVGAWRKWRSGHGNVTALQGTVRGLSALEANPSLRLNRKQAKIVLPILKEWRTKKVISDTQAKQVRDKIRAALTPTQKAKLAASSQDFRGMGGPPRRDGSRPEGPPPDGMGGPPPGDMGGPPPDGMGGPPPPRDGMDAHTRGSYGGRDRGGMGDSGGPPPGRQFGGPMGHGGPPSFPKPRDYNPLNPETSPFPFDVARNKATLDHLMRRLASAK